MKKRMIAVLTMTAMLVGSVPLASMAAEKSLSDTVKAGDTSVEARVLDGGDVSYIISIPDKIDFGVLQMPADEESHQKQVEFTVSAVQIEGLDTKTNRVAVLMKDAASTEENPDVFQITGTGEKNSKKTLKYNVLGADANKTDITGGTRYSNGYLFTAFSKADQSATGTLVLDQKQLRDDPILANWAGTYQGTINFYTAVAALGDFGSSVG